jgi:hypothetical protein
MTALMQICLGKFSFGRTISFCSVCCGKGDSRVAVKPWSWTRLHAGKREIQGRRLGKRIMSNSSKGNKNGGVASGVLLAGAVGLLALPSAVLAFSSRFEPRAIVVPAGDAPITQDVSRLAARIAPAIPLNSLGKGQMFRFTPAGNANRPDRSVTVAVRVDPQTVREISVRAPRPIAASAPGTTPLQIAPTAFSLGVSRGYHSFAQNLVTPSDSKKLDLPDLSGFRAGSVRDDGSSRFSPKIVLDQKPVPGSAPRTFVGSDELVDVGGSYSLTRNLNVTAGVRYSSQERDRLRPLTDGKKDNQAVYVGTQFRF